jgi:hypothetical protein
LGLDRFFRDHSDGKRRNTGVLHLRYSLKDASSFGRNDDSLGERMAKVRATTKRQQQIPCGDDNKKDKGKGNRQQQPQPQPQWH